MGPRNNNWWDFFHICLNSTVLWVLVVVVMEQSKIIKTAGLENTISFSFEGALRLRKRVLSAFNPCMILIMYHLESWTLNAPIWHHCPSLYGSVQTRDCRCIKGWNKLYLSSHWLKPWIPRHIPNTFPNSTNHIQRIFYMRFGFDNFVNHIFKFFCEVLQNIVMYWGTYCVLDTALEVDHIDKC